MTYDGTITIGTKLEDKEFDAQILQLERKINDMERDLEISISTGEFAEDSKEAEELRVKIEKAKNQLVSLNKQKEKYNSTGYTTGGLEGLGDLTGKAFNKIGRIVLSIFSIRSAYGAMQRASSLLAQYNSQYATDLEFIRYAIVQAIAPILEKVVKLAYTLLGYMNYLAKIWFGKPIFAENLAKNFAKASKSTSEIKKNLQTSPFDEMNVLTDTSDSGISGGGAVAPSMDPSMLQGEVPNWLKWIADNKDLIIEALIGIALAVGLIKLGDIIGSLKNLGDLIGSLKKLLKPIKTFLKEHGTTLAGILAIIGGIALIIDGVIKYLKDPSWDNFIEIMTGIAFVVGGVMLLFGGIPALITAIILSVAALGLAIYKHWNEIKETLRKVGDWINEHVIQPVAEFFKGLWDNITNGVKNAVQGVKNAFNAVVTFFKNIINKIVGLFTKIGTKVGNAVSGAFKAVVNAVLRTIENILNSPIRAVNRLINVINAIPGINIGRLPTFNLPRLAKGTILNAPGRGVPVAGGTALAGEAGREAYLPLSDTQLLEELGSTIGKYINLNATIPIYVGNRQIAREIKRINAESDFAFNR